MSAGRSTIASSGDEPVGLGAVVAPGEEAAGLEASGEVAVAREAFGSVVGLPWVQADASASAGRRIQIARGPIRTV